MRAVNQPVSWWGWHWQPPVPMSIVELISAGNLSPRLAAMLWIGMERGASVIVAADPPSAGKTTTLTALLSLTPPETIAYFTRGIGEPFAVPSRSASHPTYILINEMSDHIPVYTWNDYARRAFELLAEGYSLATTMHADTVEEVVRQLQGDLGVPPQQIANLTFIIPLHIGFAGSQRRRVREVVLLEPDGDGLKTSSIARWDSGRDDFEVLSGDGHLSAFAAWAGLSAEAIESEIGRREGWFRELLEKGTVTIPEVNAAVERYYETEIKRARRG